MLSFSFPTVLILFCFVGAVKSGVGTGAGESVSTVDVVSERA